jgi:ATP-dependent RNA helicase DeaD
MISVVHAVTSGASLDGEAVRDVRVLERVSFVAVPGSEAERVVAAVDGSSTNGAVLRLEAVGA